MLFESFAALLEYPVAPPAAICAAARQASAERHARAAAELAEFDEWTRQQSVAELQELYSRAFDFGADTGLYVGHHLFGEDGRRGLLVAGLIDRYRRLGLETGVELADHFSPVLRSLALDGDSEEARDLLRLALSPALARVLPNVRRRAEPYVPVLQALAFVIEEQTGEPCDLESDRCRLSSSPYFLTLLS